MDTKIIKVAADDAAAFFDLKKSRSAPDFELCITPHQSLSAVGFVWLIGIICVLFSLPLLAVLGSNVLWVILLAISITVAALWVSIKRNIKDRSVFEEITIWKDLICVERHNPHNANQYWAANPHWVKVNMQDTPEIENYVTLSGGTRTIELGAFLTPKERDTLFVDILHALRRAKA